MKYKEQEQQKHTNKLSQIFSSANEALNFLLVLKEIRKCLMLTENFLQIYFNRKETVKLNIHLLTLDLHDALFIIFC